MEAIDYTKYGWVPPVQESKPVANENIDYTKYGYVPPESKEGTAKSLSMAPSRIGKDLGDMILERMKQIPSYIEKAKTEVPGFVKSVATSPNIIGAGNPLIQQGMLAKNLIDKIRNPNQQTSVLNPFETQAVAGTQEAINAAAQAPLSIAQYGKNRLHLIPKSVTDVISKMTPEDTTEAINQLFGQPKQPGEALVRGLGRNADIIVPSVGLANKFNPLKLTYKNIAKDIIKTEEKNIEKYSGAEGKYNKLQEKANQRGITGDQINPNTSDLSILEKEMPTDEYVAIDNLMKDKNLVNAQKAISQLNHRERKLNAKSDRGDILTDPEKDLLKAVKNTKNHIQENMFKDSSGKIHEDLVHEHKNVQKGYATEVIPYTKNKSLQKYKQGKKLADELVPLLMKGEFPAQVGKAHKPLMIRRSMSKHPIVAGSVGLGSAGGLATLLYKALSGT